MHASSTESLTRKTQPNPSSKPKPKPSPITIPPTNLDPHYNLGYGYGSRRNSLDISKARDPNPNAKVNWDVDQTKDRETDRAGDPHTPTAYRDSSSVHSEVSPEPFNGAKNMRELEEQRRNVSVGTKASGKDDNKKREGCCGCVVM
jgi:hypothetical protein